jgi:hypothetical protein
LKLAGGICASVVCWTVKTDRERSRGKSTKREQEKEFRKRKRKIPVGERFSTPIHTGHGADPATYMMGTGSLSRGLSGRSVALTTHPDLAPRLKK